MALTEDAARFNAKAARTKAMKAEKYDEDRIIPYALRPFDGRWCYYTPVRPVWNEPRPALWSQLWKGNSFLMARPSGVAEPEGFPISFTRCLGDNDYQRGHSYYFPLRLLNGERLTERDHATLFDVLGDDPSERKPTANLAKAVREYLEILGIKDPDSNAKTAGLIWMHALAIGYSTTYLAENADGIRRDWPRIPLPLDQNTLEILGEVGRTDCISFGH